MTVMEIAKLAGVSVATVSRVINNSDLVRPATAAQVHRAVEKVGANQSLIRRGSRQGAGGRRAKHCSIAIVTVAQSHAAWFALPVMAAVIAGITREAKDHALTVQIEDAWTAGELAGAISSRRIHGALVFVPAGMPPARPMELSGALPIVRVMGDSLLWPGIDHIGADNEAAGALAAEYLLDRGCDRLAVMSHSANWEFVRRRAHGFDSYAYRRGISPAPKMFFLSENGAEADYLGQRVTAAPTAEALVDALLMKEIFETPLSLGERDRVRGPGNGMALDVPRRPHPHPLPEGKRVSPRLGLFVPRDEETVQIYRLLQSRGIIPGRDLEIVSCDHEDVRLSALDPKPASIELNTQEIGRRAIQRLMSRMKHPGEPEVRMQVAPKLELPVTRNQVSSRLIGSVGDGN